MNVALTVFFGPSASAEYAKALEYAAEFNNFTPAGKGNDLNRIETDNKEVLAKYKLYQNLLNAISGLSSAGVSFRNEELDPSDFYATVRPVAECYLQYTRSDDTTRYCDDPDSGCWGCRLIKDIIRYQDRKPFDEHSRYWYQFGSYQSKTVWNVNKDELTTALAKIAETKSVSFCPVFQYSFYRKAVAELPASIDTADKQHWGILYMEEHGADVKNWKPLGIYHKFPLGATQKQAKAIATPQDPNRKADRLSANKHLRNIPETSFADIGGIKDVIQNIREMIELPVKRPELYQHLGIQPYRGILLWGEPGNGKTLIAKAIAHELNAHFIPVPGPDILNKSFGESEKKLRDLFEEASEMQPSIIFLDEIDAIAQARLAGETSKWYATVVNQLLSLMDGIQQFGNVTVLASTNRPDLLDPALLRPGRFDYKFEVKRPNLHGCKEVLEIVTREMPLADDVDLFAFAEMVVGYSAAEITFIAREAGMTAIRRSVDVRSVIADDGFDLDFSNIKVNRSDFLSSLITLKANSKYKNKTYSLKG